MSLTPRKKRYRALIWLFVACATFALLAREFNFYWVIGVPVSVLIYAAWLMMFRCPVCGTPYLYRFESIIVIPLFFPKKCRKCGKPTSSDIN
jgi:hypothetical protein